MIFGDARTFAIESEIVTAIGISSQRGSGYFLIHYRWGKLWH